jgi:hypothetical protein
MRVSRERSPSSNHSCPWLRHLVALPIDLTPPRVWPHRAPIGVFRPAMPLRLSSAVDHGCPSCLPQAPIGCKLVLPPPSPHSAHHHKAPTAFSPSLTRLHRRGCLRIPSGARGQPNSGKLRPSHRFGRAHGESLELTGYLYRSFGVWAHQNTAASIADRPTMGAILECLRSPNRRLAVREDP